MENIHSLAIGNSPNMPGLSDSILADGTVIEESNPVRCLFGSSHSNSIAESDEKPTSFRFNGRNLFVTYPQCSLKKEEVLEEFRTRYEIDAYTVCEELHEDGSPHIHAVFTFTRKRNIRDKRAFDIKGYHPNIQSARDLQACIKYCQKDGNFLSNHRSKMDYGQLINQSENQESFLQAVEKYYPRDMVMNYDRIKAFAEFKFKKVLKPYVSNYTEFEVPGVMKSWVDCQLLGRPERPKTLVLIGDSRLGKTQWARSLGRHIYWNGMIDMETFDEEAEYIIFDDFEWEYFPNKKGWWGAQQEFTITDKYRRKRTIRWGKPMIWLGNKELILDEWCRDNCIVVKVHSPLYS